MTVQRKEIKAGSQLIFQTIYNQAGSIEKAILEYIMNSIDANATSIHIEINDNGIDYSIIDDGNGFGDASYSREEKEKCIDEVFGFLGFDHGTDEENYRVYGKFGIGRAQLWAFSKNTWHTHDMSMDVDVKFEGLSYDIQQVKEFFNGCKIVGKFYDRILPNDILAIKKELSKSSAFAPIDVFFNGKKINRNLNEIKNNLEVEGLLIELKASSSLKVYNQGIFIREYPNYTLGTGGTISSKIGFPFELNAARNDILQSKCKLWKKLKSALDNKMNSDIKRVTLTDDIRKNMLNKIASGDYGDNKEYLTKPLIKMINNRYISISNLLLKPFTICDNKDDSVAELIHREALYNVILGEYTECIGVSDIDFFENILMIREKSLFWQPKPIFKDLNEIKKTVSNVNFIIPKDQLTKRQKLFLEAINLESVFNLVSPYRTKKREIFIGKSEVANGWTDGKHYICINEDLVSKIDDGAGNIFVIMNLLIHEYLHDENNTDLHSFDFYKNCHDTMLHSANDVYNAFAVFMKAYSSRLIKNDFVINKKLNRSLSLYN